MTVQLLNVILHSIVSDGSFHLYYHFRCVL